MQPTDLDPHPAASLRRSVLLVLAIVLIGAALTFWKYSSLRAAEVASAHPGEPAEVVATAVAVERPHNATTTAIGTVRALRSVTLRNEIAGTVRAVRLTSGQIVEPGAMLVALDASVEQASLRALEAQADLAATILARTQSLADDGAASREELDRARAERDVAVAEIARLRAVIARKTIRAPFRARVGLADVHTGQYLSEGTELTTLQGVADPVNVDFAVSQAVAGGLRVGQRVDVFTGTDSAPVAASIVAVDARVDQETRNATVRARLAHGEMVPAPGASVRVRIPTGPARPADEVIVAGGVAVGEQVATSGSFKLRDGALVQVKDASVASSAGGR
jgi:membrane fusion protein (multidrug efflux system)